MTVPQAGSRPWAREANLAIQRTCPAHILRPAAPVGGDATPRVCVLCNMCQCVSARVSVCASACGSVDRVYFRVRVCVLCPLSGPVMLQNVLQALRLFGGLRACAGPCACGARDIYCMQSALCDLSHRSGFRFTIPMQRQDPTHTKVFRGLSPQVGAYKHVDALNTA